MVILSGLLAATGYALGTVLQQRGALQTGDAVSGWRFLVVLFRRPVWLLGGVVMAVGWVFQAVALHTGSLMQVQSLVTLSLVIALPFGAWLTAQRITRAVWAGAAALVIGIVLFLSLGSPSGGTESPAARDWWIAGGVSAGLALVLARFGARRGGAVRALAYGAGSGLGYGFATAVTKVFTGIVGGGLSALLGSWETYVMVGAGVVGMALNQSALRTGALAPAMAATNAMTLLTCIVLGLTVFGESIQHGGGQLVVVVVGLGLALLGIVLLAAAPAARPAAEASRGEEAKR
ncbi:DMT family transporter [Actinoplanes sp. KI2]|uniref:DMT family transporter n=1 Tax=Actinoplanes sp. KI2 TaxID=2983315 RepID=UPI0021D5FA00|nr:DMT family transporter [Actinoplanes sp. KI2]MCU7722515.1 DMT family transporter [Actinoplanes sp. KI2]